MEEHRPCGGLAGFWKWTGGGRAQDSSAAHRFLFQAAALRVFQSGTLLEDVKDVGRGP